MKSSKLMIGTLGAAIVTGCLATATASALLQRQAIESRNAVETIEGKIESVKLDRNEIVLDVKSDTMEQGSKKITIKINERTAYTLDGEVSTRELALKEGREAKVAHEQMLASRIDVKTDGQPG